MKRNQDFLLELSFKIGKILSTFLLVIVSLVIIGAGIVFMTSSTQKISTPTFDTIKEEIQTAINSDKSQTQNQENLEKKSNINYDKYDNSIIKIISKNNLTPDMKQVIKKHLKNIPEKLRTKYLDGLDIFYRDGLKTLNDSNEIMETYLWNAVKSQVNYYSRNYEFAQAKKNIKENGKYNKYICIGLFNDYNYLFNETIQEMQEEEVSNMMKRYISASVFGIGLLLFILLLFLPLLIKIEENTRIARSEETQNNENNEDTKVCPFCGKIIKISAKKCRFCNKWLDGRENNDGGNE